MQKKYENYKNKIKELREEIIYLNRAITELQDTIDKDYNSVIKKQNLRIAEQYRAFTLKDDELVQMTRKHYDAVRSYRALYKLTVDAQKLGINTDCWELPEDNKYKGFKQTSKFMEDGKVRTVFETQSIKNIKGKKK